MKSLIDASAIHSAAHRIRKDIIRTATIESPNLSSIIKRPVYLKLENTQIGGSFKARGVLNKFAEIKSELPSQRFAAVSGGNFGIAIAQAAANLNAHVTIIMPKTAPASSIAKIRALGIPVIVTEDVREAFLQSELLAQQGYTILDDCDDTVIAEGHGTLAQEFIEDCPALTDVFLAIGGGTMLAGVATALKAIKPEIRIWGVETDGAASMDRALRAKTPVEIEVSSIISTLGVPIVSDRMLRHAQAYLEDVLIVSDREAIAGMISFGENAGQWVELASGATLAGAIHVAKKLPSAAVVGVVVCGGNITAQDMRNWIAYSSQD